MAIDNPQAVKFCNEKIRVLADVLLTAYRTAEAVVDFYYANPDLAATFSGRSADFVADGSELDGRTRLTGDDVLLLISRANELLSDYRATNNAKLNTVLKVAVNGPSRV